MSAEGGDFHRQLFEEVSDGIVVYDPETAVVVDANPAVAELTGYSIDALVGRPVVQFSSGPPEEVERAAAELVDMAAEVDQRFEWPIERADGGIRTAEVSLHRTEIDGDDRVLAILRDVTERERDRVALEESRQRLSLLTRHSPDVFWMFSADWEQCLFVNDAYERIWGRPTEGLEADPADFLAGTHPEDRETVREAMERLANGSRVEIEYRVNEGENFERWVSVEGVPIYEDGELTQHVGFARDITRRKRLVSDLREQNERLSALTENVPVILFEFDEDGVFVQSTGSGLDAIGREPGQVVGKSIEEVYADHEGILDACRRALGGQSVSLTVEVEDVVFDAWYEPTYDDSDDVDGVIGVAVDVTERQRLESELRVSERELERQNEQLEEFAHVIAHDIRGPLTAAMGFFELALETDAEEYFRRVADAHARMERMIDDLLTLARQGRSIAEREPVDVAELARTARAQVRGDATVEIEDGLPKISADASRLEEVVANLFQNAVDHAEPGVTIRIGPLDTADGPETAGFYVEDDGPGIPPEKRSHVFDFGYTTNPTGTGLGLSVVEEVVEAHGWSVTVTGGRDGGARFEIETDGTVPTTPG
ncbi:PAS domain S-box protein [Halobellus sp. EA9]|uniref:PAS domain S-box protein n=1 Tax=Halobellus sp. EA9 TaxID=3421647 RepID=UPI003EB729B9